MANATFAIGRFSFGGNMTDTYELIQMVEQCNQNYCPYCKPKPKYTVTKEGSRNRGKEALFLFCNKAQRDVLSKDLFPFPEWCPLTKEERKAG